MIIILAWLKNIALLLVFLLMIYLVSPFLGGQILLGFWTIFGLYTIPLVLAIAIPWKTIGRSRKNK